MFRSERSACLALSVVDRGGGPIELWAPHESGPHAQEEVARTRGGAIGGSRGDEGNAVNDAEQGTDRPGEPSGASDGATAAVTASQPTAPGKTSDQVALESLAPHYDEGQHKTYVDRLEKAVEDPRNRNIALSGRYGTCLLY